MPDLTEERRAELTRLTRLHHGAIRYVQERAQTRTPTLAQLADTLLDGGAGGGGGLQEDCRKALRYIQGDPELRRLTLAEYRPGWGGDGLAGIALEDVDGERRHFDRNGLICGEVGYAQGLSARWLRARKRKRTRAVLCFAAALAVVAAAIAFRVIEDAKRREAYYAELLVLFKEHLQEKYAGTYYDGEFVVGEKIDRGGAPFGIYYGAEAYREDRPDLPFHVHTAMKDGQEYITDDFFLQYSSWEEAHAIADTVERIFGKEVLYSGGVGWMDVDIKDRLLKRNGYADLASHYAEDNTFPSIDIIVFTKTFDEDQACADIVELYDAFVAGKSEDWFYLSVFYTSSDDTERGPNVGSGSFGGLTRYFNPDDYLAYINLGYNAKREDDWRNQYPSLADFIKDDIKKGREYFEECVRNGRFN